MANNKVSNITYSNTTYDLYDSDAIHTEGGTISGDLTVNGSIYSSNIVSTGSITASGSITAGSKRSLKKDIVSTTHTNAVSEISNIDIVDFKYKNDKNEIQHIGFISDDTDEVFSTKFRDRMDVNNCIGMLLKAVQELSSEIKTLKKEIEEIKKQ